MNIMAERNVVFSQSHVHLQAFALLMQPVHPSTFVPALRDAP